MITVLLLPAHIPTLQTGSAHMPYPSELLYLPPSIFFFFIRPMRIKGISTQQNLTKPIQTYSQLNEFPWPIQ